MVGLAEQLRKVEIQGAPFCITAERSGEPFTFHFAAKTRTELEAEVERREGEGYINVQPISHHLCETARNG